MQIFILLVCTKVKSCLSEIRCRYIWALSVFLFLFVLSLSLVMSSYFSGASPVHLCAGSAVADGDPPPRTLMGYLVLSLVISKHVDAVRV